MRIELQTLEPQRIVVVALLNRFAELLGATNHIDLISVATEENYGNTLKSIDPKATYTNNEKQVGFGKTIQISETQSSIVLREEIILAALMGLQPGKTESELSLSFYMIMHEMGHAIDNGLRSSQYFPDDNISTVGWSLDLLKEYYTPILLSEFSANHNCRLIAMDHVWQLVLTAFAKSYASSLEEISRERNLYHSGHSSLNKLAQTVSHSCWFIFIEFAKFVAIFDDSKKLTDFLPRSFERRPIAVLSTYLSNLRLIRATYPEISKEVTVLICQNWYEFCESLGYKFSMTEDNTRLDFV